MKHKTENYHLTGHLYHLLSCILLLLIFLMAGCREKEEKPTAIPLPETARERYLAALDSIGLADTRMVKVWRRAGDNALTDSMIAEPPFRETGYFRAEEPEALSYRLQIQTGEVMRVDVNSTPSGIQFFADLFQMEKTDSAEVLSRVFSAEEDWGDSLQYEVKEPGRFLLRIQPELLATCRFTIDIKIQPAYGCFPVTGKSNSDIWSFFGDPRGGGRRKHKGIDIFARRGTPVVAVTDGYVMRVRNGGLGGKQVWLRDPLRRQALYYAHLDSQLVENGARVRAGDTLGLVGNTGNASTTRPHLHFSIYRRGSGAIDPWPFVARRSGRMPDPGIDTSWLGHLARVRLASYNLHSGPKSQTPTLETLPRHLPVRVVAASQGWYRVQTPEGKRGYLRPAALEHTDKPLQQLEATRAWELLSHPHAEAQPMSAVQPEEGLSILGHTSGYSLVRTAAGTIGWIPLSMN
jgi:murein DD-endopeptidase MepM/ murein hydrolase activator NlpD/SH3-like domain-containing protein